MNAVACGERRHVVAWFSTRAVEPVRGRSVLQSCGCAAPRPEDESVPVRSSQRAPRLGRATICSPFLFSHYSRSMCHVTPLDSLTGCHIPNINCHKI